MKKLFLFALLALSFGAHAQGGEEIDPEYLERSFEEVQAGRGHRPSWKKHPNPGAYKGDLYYAAYDDGNSVAVMGDGMVLFKISLGEDSYVVIEWKDFWATYCESDRTLTTWDRYNRKIASMSVPDGWVVKDYFISYMSDHEIWNHCFDLELLETDGRSVKRFDRHMRPISKKVR
jgi:hypothetical protein